jgi:hypothetical protein
LLHRRDKSTAIGMYHHPMMGRLQWARALGSVVVVLLVAGCSFGGNSPKDDAMNACTILGKSRVKISDGVATMEEIRPALEKAAKDARSAAGGDSQWRSLADSLRDLNAANVDSKAFTGENERAWTICAPYVGT